VDLHVRKGGQWVSVWSDETPTADHQHQPVAGNPAEDRGRAALRAFQLMIKATISVARACIVLAEERRKKVQKAASIVDHDRANRLRLE
jgi:hypothetical protein